MLHQPRKLLVRRVMFQIHLWIGLALALYILIIGITGSLLVFRQELTTRALPAEWRALRTATPVTASAVVAHLNAAYANPRIVSVTAPSEHYPLFVATLGATPGSRERISVACDPRSGEVLGPMPRPPAWLTFTRRLHETLLIGGTGRVWNGVGGAALLVLVATGLVNWWPGLGTWKRALQVDFRLGWRRVNFDLHRASGFWSAALLSVWALSGVYFAWPQELTRMVTAWSPVVSARPPAVTVQPSAGAASANLPVPDLDEMITRAVALDPGTTWAGLQFPYGRTAPLQVILRRTAGDGRPYEDTVYFNPYTGAHLTTWRYGVNESVADWFIWLQVPLHFGTSWGLTIKILWALAGLVLPLLALTGLVMYWNRVLRHAMPASRRLAVRAP